MEGEAEKLGQGHGMNWQFRPPILILTLVALVLGAAALALLPWPRDTRPAPLPVPAGSQEVAWLYSATNTSTWERFVAAARTAAARLRDEHPEVDLPPPDDSKAFPPETTTVPELSLSLPGGQRLLLRWYKLTSDWKTVPWVEALCRRQPPPLAIIGGSSSDPAIELADALAAAGRAQPAAPLPLLLLTTATADERYRDGQPESLPHIYDGRTFRFCFTNQQMTDALTECLYEQDTLRPDPDAVYSVSWEDDLYSQDLEMRLYQGLTRPTEVRAVARDWAWQTGAVATGGFPLDLAKLADHRGGLPPRERVYWSVGGFSHPNPWEADAARNLIEKLGQNPPHGANRPALILAAGSDKPARRLLRGLVRTAPVQARRFVVVTGDGLSFNTVYRDRKLSWAIQDLPFDLVFFCHRNPADASAGFNPENHAGSGQGPLDITGTEDLLLFVDMIEALLQSGLDKGSLPQTGDDLGRKLREARWQTTGGDGRVRYRSEGPLLFDEHGNRRSGTGEHVVWVQPVIHGDRLLPQATIQVWFRPPDAERDHGPRWRPGSKLHTDYDTGTED
jgi:hypothetical protein